MVLGGFTVRVLIPKLRSFFMLPFSARQIPNLIVTRLAETPRRTAKQLFKSVSKQHEISYQAVHKALKDLLREGVLEKNPLGHYSVSLDYLRNLKAFIHSATNDYPDSIIDYKFIVLDSMSEVDDYLIEVGFKLFKKNKQLSMNWSHFWIPLFERKKTYASMKKMVMLSKTYTITPGATTVDKWCENYWSKLCHAKSNAGIAGSDFAVYDNHVIQVFYPAELRKKLDKIYAKAKSMQELDIDELYEKVFRAKAKIPVLVIHNPILAKQLEDEIKGYFKN